MPDAELFFAQRNDCSQFVTPTAEQFWRCVTVVYHRQIIHEPLPLKPLPLSDLNLTPCFALFPTPFAARAFFFLAQIELLNILAVQKFLLRALHDDAPNLQNIPKLGNL